MILKKNILIVLILTAFSLSVCRDAFSQNSSKDKPGNPMLDGHEFIVNGFIENPFLTTTLKSKLGFATSLSTEIPLLRLADTTNLKIDADISYVNGGFEYQNAIQDWAAIWVNFSGIARIGTNTASIFISGVTANSSFETGMLFKIKEWKKTYLSSSIRITNTSTTILNIFPFIRGIVDSNFNFTTNRLVNTLNPLAGEVDVRAAFSPEKHWSILSYIKGGYGENVEVDEIKNRFTYELGATANYNLNTRNDFPLGIGAGFKLNSQSPTLEYSKRLTQSYMLQLAYTGREDFLLSLESLYTVIPVNYRDVTINLSSFAFSWAYFF